MVRTRALKNMNPNTLQPSSLTPRSSQTVPTSTPSVSMNSLTPISDHNYETSSSASTVAVVNPPYFNESMRHITRQAEPPRLTLQYSIQPSTSTSNSTAYQFVANLLPHRTTREITIRLYNNPTSFTTGDNGGENDHCPPIRVEFYEKTESDPNVVQTPNSRQEHFQLQQQRQDESVSVNSERMITAIAPLTTTATPPANREVDGFTPTTSSVDNNDRTTVRVGKRKGALDKVGEISAKKPRAHSSAGEDSIVGNVAKKNASGTEVKKMKTSNPEEIQQREEHGATQRKHTTTAGPSYVVNKSVDERMPIKPASVQPEIVVVDDEVSISAKVKEKTIETEKVENPTKTRVPLSQDAKKAILNEASDNKVAINFDSKQKNKALDEAASSASKQKAPRIRKNQQAEKVISPSKKDHSPIDSEGKGKEISSNQSSSSVLKIDKDYTRDQKRGNDHEVIKSTVSLKPENTVKDVKIAQKLEKKSDDVKLNRSSNKRDAIITNAVTESRVEQNRIEGVLTVPKSQHTRTEQNSATVDKNLSENEVIMDGTMIAKKFDGDSVVRGKIDSQLNGAYFCSFENGKKTKLSSAKVLDAIALYKITFGQESKETTEVIATGQNIVDSQTVTSKLKRNNAGLNQSNPEIATDSEQIKVETIENEEYLAGVSVAKIFDGDKVVKGHIDLVKGGMYFCSFENGKKTKLSAAKVSEGIILFSETFGQRTTKPEENFDVPSSETLRALIKDPQYRPNDSANTPTPSITSTPSLNVISNSITDQVEVDKIQYEEYQVGTSLAKIVDGSKVAKGRIDLVKDGVYFCSFENGKKTKLSAAKVSEGILLHRTTFGNDNVNKGEPDPKDDVSASSSSSKSSFVSDASSSSSSSATSSSSSDGSKGNPSQTKDVSREKPQKRPPLLSPGKVVLVKK